MSDHSFSPNIVENQLLMKDYPSYFPSNQNFPESGFLDTNVNLVKDNEESVPIYRTEDLAKYWCDEKLTSFKDDYLYYEYKFYEHQMDELELFFFWDVVSERIDYVLSEIVALLNAHPNKLLIHFALLERLIFRKNELLLIGENNESSYPVQKKTAIVRFECLIEFVKILSQQIPVHNNKLRWRGNFSHFVEILDALSLTGNLNGLNALDAFNRIHNFIEFDVPKSAKIFEVTMYKNRNRKKSNAPYIEELLVQYKNKLKENLDKSDNLKIIKKK